MVSVAFKQTKFVDLDLNFGFHPVTKDVLKKVDTNAIITAVKNLIRTQNGQRLFHPEIGCQISGLLFEPFTANIKNLMERTIKYALDNFEPRAEIILIKVDANTDQKLLTVTVIFTPIGTLETVQTSFTLERTI